MKKLTCSFLLVLLCLTGCASSPNRQEFTLQGDHGQLAAVLQTPKHKKTYPLVLILHGFNANKEMYLLTNLADQLNQHGIATLIFDFNGHGQSEGSFLDMTAYNELEDARRVYAYASRLPQVDSVSAVGHSLGAIVAGMLAGELGSEKVKTLVLMAPAAEIVDDTVQGNLFDIQYDPHHIPPSITLRNGLEVGRAFLETSQHLPIRQNAERYTGPVLIIHSKDDQLVPYRYGEELSQIYPHATLETLHKLDHNFTQDTPGVNAIIVQFLDQKLNP